MKKTLLSVMSLFFVGAAFAQVEDISVTVAPTAGYTWWDNKTAIEDGLMVGGQVGFGFGRGIELRGIYEQSVDLKSEVSKITDDKKWIDKFEARDVKVTRWGGEFKANIPTGGWLAPYLTLGSGVQKLEVEKNKQEQIYATAGLGTKFNIGDRVTFNIEGKASAFNMDPSNTLYDRSGSTSSNEINKWINEKTSANNMINWSVMAGFQFYLGGRTPEEMNAVEAAYNRQFGGGLRGFKFVLEPGIAYLNFDNESNMKDTYLVGGSAGFDFTEYVGIRGFYYQSTKDKRLSTKWDRMALYGGDFLARLNVARGVVPYITVGGGYMNVYDSYVGKDGLTGGKSGYFAKGGLGLSIPLGKFVEVYGAANMLLTTANADDPSVVASDLRSPEELRKNIMYSGGLRFKLGAAADGGSTLKSYVSEREDKIIEAKNKRIAELEKELKEAYDNNDTDEAVRIIKEKQEVEKVYKEKAAHSDDKIRMTPAELQSLVNEVIEGVESKQGKAQTQDDRIDRLEKLLLEVNTNNNQPQAQPVQSQQSVQSTKQDEINKQILQELKKINDNMNKISYQSQPQQATDKTIVVTPGTTTPATNVEGAITPAIVENAQANDKGVAKSVFYYKGTSVYGGVNFGGGILGILGVRAHYGFTNSSIEFAPDLMLGFGKKNAYGLNANVLLPFNYEQGVIAKPYVGLGLGLNKFDNGFKFGPNIIVGTSFNVLNGQLYVDYTSRNLFANNQIAVGYRFGF